MIVRGRECVLDLNDKTSQKGQRQRGAACPALQAGVLYLLRAVRRPEPCTEVVPNFLEIICCGHQNQTRTKRAGSITDDDVGLVETLVVAPVENAAVERYEDCSVYCFENGHVVPGLRQIY